MMPKAEHDGAEWLVRSHPDAVRARAEWWEHGVALFPVAHAWDVVKLPADQVHVRTSGELPARVRELLAEYGVTGPVSYSPTSRFYYLLVPTGAAERWGAATEHPPDICYLGLPAVGRLAAPGAYWVTPPDGSGHLSDPAAVGVLADAVFPQPDVLTIGAPETVKP